MAEPTPSIAIHPSRQASAPAAYVSAGALTNGRPWEGAGCPRGRS
jgi:hypothetical protein